MHKNASNYSQLSKRKIDSFQKNSKTVSKMNYLQNEEDGVNSDSSFKTI